MSTSAKHSIAAIVPAAGVGKRMQSDTPKQYLTIGGKCVIEHTLEKLLQVAAIEKIVVVLSKHDDVFETLAIAKHPRISTEIGGAERVDSVYAGLTSLNDEYQWALVHDAARPCVEPGDIKALIATCTESTEGGLLAYPAKDTIKRANADGNVETTVSRELIWHALTPQMYKVHDLVKAIDFSLAQQFTITDESSAIEAVNKPSHLVVGSSLNIKITSPEDLHLAEMILQQQVNT
ncbi:2-C-methyl-D-erythritol 4-phosphate cytidylyltransferase [Thalassotalea agarivorans]|uniref:2-C-methyl-D-erythritol 4-phosphate cytidylyltransferase n=1 Tax=Thalassotalea agarivorans TaxID=349064 RepID=A0A1H9ZDS2_THASX|nr:2-C-methyl-D-erythritol 4-phosphate cytidylyltransferase [Thalassotalea agarivorans]SES79730.1 2-C-methyl-D-erythritol 4-phosphate cytidylyltransferase [Thalassotalea agarivorans]